VRDHQEPVLAAAQKLARNRSGRGLDAETYRSALARVQGAEARAPEELRPYLSTEREVLDTIQRSLANRDVNTLRKIDPGQLQESSAQLILRCRSAG
jgi:hypothetical protein